METYPQVEVLEALSRKVSYRNVKNYRLQPWNSKIFSASQQILPKIPVETYPLVEVLEAVSLGHGDVVPVVVTAEVP